MNETSGLRETEAPAGEETSRLSLASIAGPNDREMAMLYRHPDADAGMVPLEIGAAQDPIKSYIDELSPRIAKALDLKVLPGEATDKRIEAIHGLLDWTHAEIFKLAHGEPKLAKSSYEALLKSVAANDKKFGEGGFDLVLRTDPKTEAVIDTIIIPGALNQHAKSVAEKFDSGREDQVQQAKVEFFKALEGQPQSAKIPFMVAIDSYEKGAPGREKHAMTIRDQTGKYKDAFIGWTHKPTEAEKQRIREEAVKENLKIPEPHELIRFEDLLSKYKTPIGDAYKKSKGLEKGHPGKSETLEAVVDGILKSKDLHEIQVTFVPQEQDNFDPSRNILSLDINKTATKQIESFVHEGTHAAFQDIKNLYLTPELHRETFLDLKVGPHGDEARAYEAQMKVFEEITHSMGSSGIYGEYINDRGEVNLVNLADIYHNQGKEAFVRYLMEEAKSRFSSGNQRATVTYRENYDLMYDSSFSPLADFYHQQKAKYSALYKNGGETVRRLIDAGF